VYEVKGVKHMKLPVKNSLLRRDFYVFILELTKCFVLEFYHDLKLSRTAQYFKPSKHDSSINEETSRNRGMLEKLIFAQLIKKYLDLMTSICPLPCSQ
jgi:hypothetical protein